MSYGKVKETFWTDEKVQTWPAEAKLLALYFLSGPHRNILGCARVPDGYILSDLKWDQRTLEDAVHCLAENDFIERDDRTGWTLIVNQLRHDPPLNKNHGTAMLRLAAEVPPGRVSDALRPRLADSLKPIGMGIEALPKPPPQPIATPEPEPEPLPEPRKQDARQEPRADVLPPELIPDPRKAIFDDGLRWLAKAVGRPERGLRGMLGRWIKVRGDPDVAAALVAAQQNNPVDPIAWIEARLKSNGQRKPSDLQRRRALAEEFLGLDVGEPETGGASGDQAPSGEAIASVPDGPSRRY